MLHYLNYHRWSRTDLVSQIPRGLLGNRGGVGNLAGLEVDIRETGDPVLGDPGIQILEMEIRISGFPSRIPR